MVCYFVQSSVDASWVIASKIVPCLSHGWLQFDVLIQK